MSSFSVWHWRITYLLSSIENCLCLWSWSWKMAPWTTKKTLIMKIIISWHISNKISNLKTSCQNKHMIKKQTCFPTQHSARPSRHILAHHWAPLCGRHDVHAGCVSSPAPTWSLPSRLHGYPQDRSVTWERSGIWSNVSFEKFYKVL